MNWSFVLWTVVTGLAVVFIILIFLIVLLTIMGKVFTAKKKTVIQPAKKINPLPKPYVGDAVLSVPKKIETPRVDELQVIAVIMAAIEAYGGKKIKVIDIKKREDNARSAWGAAGVYESMR